MKILVLSYEYPPIGGGASPVCRDLSREFSRMGHEVDVVTMGYKDLPREEQIDGLTIHRVPCIRSKAHICYTHEMSTYLYTGFRKAASLARLKSYDVVHSHFIFPSGVIAYLLHRQFGIPYILTPHGSDIPSYNPDRFKRLHVLLAPFWNKIVGSAAAITTASNGLKELLLQSAPWLTDVTAIPYGADPDRFTPNSKKRSIVLVSRIFQRKGFQFFLQAIKDMDLDYQVDILGDGPYLSNLRDLADEVQTPVNFRGWVDRESKEYRESLEHSSIFVFPSSSDNFPVVLQDAMLAANAIVSSNIPGCREMLGTSALYVHPENSGEIKSQLCRLLSSENLQQNLGQSARNRAVTLFGHEAVAKNYCDIFESVH